MANDAKVVCKNVFKNCDKAAFTKAFTLKWIELINQYEKKICYVSSEKEKEV